MLVQAGLNVEQPHEMEAHPLRSICFACRAADLRLCVCPKSAEDVNAWATFTLQRACGSVAVHCSVAQAVCVSAASHRRS
jgi:hypothetical protein